MHINNKRAYTKIAKQIIVQVGNADDMEAMSPNELEKEALQKENTDLKTEKSVADRVMYKKLGLAPHVIDKMKADAARKILQEQQRDDDVLF